MKKIVSLFIAVLIVSGAMCADSLTLTSPSGKITLKVWMGKHLTYLVQHNNLIIVQPSFIDLQPSAKAGISGASIRRSRASRVNDKIISPVPEKRKSIDDIFSRLLLEFDRPYTVEFRAYDDGVAYRISTRFRDSLIINDELAEFNFPGTPSGYFPEIEEKKGEDAFHTSFEHTYNFKRLDSFPGSSIAYSPLLIVPESGPKLAIIESDLEEYPGLFVRGKAASGLRSAFARYPLEESLLEGLYSQKRVAKRADYIARTAGTRSFPWRIIMIAERDVELPSNDIVYRLASPSRVKDVSWIRPGNITDEWIIELNVFDVPFRAGRNTDTYKYYIDFASRFGIDRIMMDAGWSDNNDLFKVIPEINMDSLVAYAKSKGVKIAMWTLALTLDKQLDSALDQFNRWGVDFIMTDFIDRDDQKAVQLHHRIAKACADHGIMIMFHGSFPPKGFNRTYPNAVAREAVLGSEYNMWSDRVSPDHDVQLAFTRMLAGSLDYEPGLLMNVPKKAFRAIEGYVMSFGTRCHQLSMYVVYDSPVQFFSGNPSQGFKEPEFMELLGSIPSLWDETRILDAKVGEYIVTARNNGGNWYIGGMTGWNEREVEINLDFLDSGEYEATICKDGINADRYGSDYNIEKKNAKKGDVLKLHMAPGGGFLIKLMKQ